MLNLMKPKYFIPIHGEYRMLRQHAILAESVGIPKEDIFMCDNGDTVEIQNGVARKGSKVQSGNILIDGLRCWRCRQYCSCVIVNYCRKMEF